MAETTARGRLVEFGKAVWIEGRWNEGGRFTCSPGWIGPLRYWKARRYAKRAGIQLEVPCPTPYGEHVVVFLAEGEHRRFAVEHPSVRDTVCDCPLAEELSVLAALVAATTPGRYRATHNNETGEWHLDPVPAGGTDG